MAVRVAARAALCGAILASAATQASASNEMLSDAALLSRATAVFSVKTAPADRILGLHKGRRVIVDVRCGDVCPAYTVRIIHYDVEPGPACTQLGADTASVLVPMAITVASQSFCVPHILYIRKLYTDRPYRN